MAKGNFAHNYPKVIEYLERNGYEYHQFDKTGQHIRILSDLAIIDLWPSRMKYHIVQSEGVERIGYYSLGFWFDENKFKKLLEGEL